LNENLITPCEYFYLPPCTSYIRTIVNRMTRSHISWPYSKVHG